jgi:hypothetical protein
MNPEPVEPSLWDESITPPNGQGTKPADWDHAAWPTS